MRLVNKHTKTCHDFVLEDDVLVYRPRNPIRMAKEVLRRRYADEQKRKWDKLCDEDTGSACNEVVSSPQLSLLKLKRKNEINLVMRTQVQHAMK